MASTIFQVPQDYPPEIIGYADPWIVDPGDAIEVKVSSTEPQYTSRVVRLIQGLDIPRSPKVAFENVIELPQDVHQGRFQLANPGSYGVVYRTGLSVEDEGVGVTLFVRPTLIDAGHDQTIFSILESGVTASRGLAAAINSTGHLKILVGSGETDAEAMLFDYRFIKNQWLKLSIEAYKSTVKVTIEPLIHLSQRSGPAFYEERELSGHARPYSGNLRAIAISDTVPLTIAAARLRADGRATDMFNGRIGAVRLSRLWTNEHAPLTIQTETLVSLDLSLEMSTDTMIDVSGHGRHGRLINAPTRAVRGHDWDGSQTDWTKASYGYGAVHFHEDDLDDAGWSTDFAFRIPSGARSGAYAVQVQSTSNPSITDQIVFFVRPGPQSTAKVALVLSTFTYTAYANEHMYDEKKSSRLDLIGQQPEKILMDENFARMRRRSDLGLSLYDVHTDGSGNVFSSTKRPILNVRPGFQHWAFGRPREFSADLLMIGFLERLALDYDVITDHCLHHRGVDGLTRYNTLITGSHPEYPTLQSLNAYSDFASRGGNIAYLGGNGFYWLSVADERNPHRLEVRRGDQGVRTFGLPGGERHHSLNGAQGGLWRSRGRAANYLFGVGCCGEGIGPGVPYSRAMALANQPPTPEITAARDEYAWVFDGLGPSELIGPQGFGGGASGDEIDRWDPEHGSPEDAVVLASSTGHSDEFGLFPEDSGFQDTQTLGTQTARIRSDIVMRRTPGGGLVFSVGSMNWYCSLGWDDYQNNIAQITENVVRRMAESPLIR